LLLSLIAPIIVVPVCALIEVNFTNKIKVAIKNIFMVVIDKQTYS